MGELFKHFEGWDVQALRQETENVKRELKKEQGESIQKLVKVIKELSGSQKYAEQKLVEEYKLSEENAAKKVALYW